MKEKSPIYIEVAQWLERYGTIDTTKVYEILKKNGSNNSRPSTIINRLRKWGIELSSTRVSNHVTRWDKEYFNPDFVCHREECCRCGTSIFISLPPEERPDDHIICKKCEENPPLSAKLKKIKKESEECKIFKPGDEGFDERAQKCAPPSEIKEQSWGGKTRLGEQNGKFSSVCP